MGEKSNTFLETEPVGRLMRRYAVPCVISLVVAALYNVVDQIFIANATYLGSYGNAANTVVFPLTVVALAIAVLIGDGCCAFVSISLGAGRKEDAHRSIGNAIVLGVLLSVILTAALSIWYLFHMKAVKLSRGSFGMWGGLMKQFLTLGITSFLAQIALVLSMAAFQNMCTKYGARDPIFGQAEYSQIPLAVMGIVMKFYQIAISISIGMAAGCIPVVGYNIGAGRKDRAKKLFTHLLTWEMVIGLIALVIVEVFPRQLIGIFGADNESSYYTDFAIRSFHIYLCLIVLSMVNKGTFIYLQAMGKALESTLISLTREVIFGVSLPIILPIFFGLDGLLYSFPLSDILTFFFALFIIIRTYRQLSVTEPKNAAAQSGDCKRT